MVESAPDELRARLRAAIKASDPKTDAASLSAALGRGKDYIADFLAGKKKSLGAAELASLERLLGLPVAFFLGAADGAAQPNVTLRHPIEFGRVKVPVYGQAMGGEDGRFILNGNKIDDILAPSSLAGIAEAYAIYVSGDSMEPRYFAGEAVFVNPRMPVRRGDFVIIQIRPSVDGDAPHGYVKRFVRMGQELVVEQYNPAKQLMFPAADVISVHRVMMGGDG